MARIRLSALVLVCAAAVFPWAARGQGAEGKRAAVSVFLDRSGSMTPYYESGLIDKIVHPLQRAAASEGSLSEFAFSTSVDRVQSLQALESSAYGTFTYLDKVIDQCERDRTPMAWIVTDNIEDTGEAGNTERFYAKLHGADVLRVTVFPVLAPAGRPGLIVYALLFEGGSNEAYERALEQFRTGAQGVIRTNALLMKPVDRGTVEVTSRKMTPLTRRGNEKVYGTGAPIRETVEVRFRSKFDHIQIMDSRLRVLQSVAAFQPGSVLVPERRDIAITPDRIRALGPRDETAQVYLLTIDLGKLELKHSPAALWRAAWSKPIEEQLNLQFEIDVPGQNFQLRPQFLREFSASTLEEARATGKVYAIDRLLSRVNGDFTRIQVDSPLFFKVQYPTWPAVLWLLLFAFGLAVLGGLLWLGRRLIPTRKKNWEVRAEAPGGYEMVAKLEGGAVTVEGDAIGRVEKNQLLPTGTTQLERGAQRIPLLNGIRVPVRTRRSQMDLIFNEVVGELGRTVGQGPGSAADEPSKSRLQGVPGVGQQQTPGRPTSASAAPPRRR